MKKYFSIRAIGLRMRCVGGLCGTPQAVQRRHLHKAHRIVACAALKKSSFTTSHEGAAVARVLAATRVAGL
jgi:hypothetical protein